MQIYPSILEFSIETFSQKMSLLAPFFNHFQIDIADGKFVPNKTFQIDEITGHETLLKNKTFEFHLMVEDYDKEIKKLESISKYIQITSVLIHIKTMMGNHSVAMLPSDKKIWKYGVVLNPEDSVSDYWEKIQQFKIVQIMTVHPGAQGTPFVPEALDKIDQLRKCGFSGKIILDGAINDNSLKIITGRKHLPDAVAPGSYFSEDIASRLEKLKKFV